MKLEDAEKGIKLAHKSMHYLECAGKIKSARPVSMNYHSVAGEANGCGFSATFDFDDEQMKMLKAMFEASAAKYRLEANELGVEF